MNLIIILTIILIVGLVILKTSKDTDVEFIGFTMTLTSGMIIAGILLASLAFMLGRAEEKNDLDTRYVVLSQAYEEQIFENMPEKEALLYNEITEYNKDVKHILKWIESDWSGRLFYSYDYWHDIKLIKLE